MTAIQEVRITIHPRSVRGRFRMTKWIVLLLGYGVYFLLPWLRWERSHGPDQAVLFDIPGRHFYIFDLLVHAQDIFWLGAVLIIAALLLFLVTGLAGRVFCGYFCFQTLWTDAFIWIERRIQGDRGARQRLDAQPWGPRKLLLKATTHGLFLLLAFATGFSFVLYWADAPTLTRDFFLGQAAFAAYFTTGLLTLTTYLMAGLLREQVCTYMCPYARFQSVMFDRNTLIVSYDPRRGEGRAGRAPLDREKDDRGREARHQHGHGDCIDCGLCVQVCPAGIDIRDGLQYQCIHCALCVDACDGMMDRLGWPRGLVRYTSENALAGGRTRLLRAKTLGYGLPMLLIGGLLVWAISHQAPLDASVSQVRQPLYVQLSDGAIQNSYEIKLNNKSQQSLILEIRIQGLEGAELDTGRIERVELLPEQRTSVLARVRMHPPEASALRQDLVFELHPIEPAGLKPLRIPSQFMIP